MADGVLVAGYFGLGTLAVILYDTWFDHTQRNTKKQTFSVLAGLVALSIVLNQLYYTPLNLTDVVVVRYALPLLRFSVPFLACIMFLQYIFLHIKRKITISRHYFLCGMLFCFIGIVSTFYYGIGGKLFTADGGAFRNGEFYEGYLLSFQLVNLYMMILTLIYSGKLGFHDTIAALLFLIIPSAFITVSLVSAGDDYYIPSLSVSMLIISRMLQSEREKRLMESQAESSLLAHVDELTGLQNRLAFGEFCDRLEGDGNVGVLFADLNGLKYANDHYGHKAGDRLLSDFAEMMRACFDAENLYRISGDEFVAVVPDISRKQFESRVKQLAALSHKTEPPAAAIGSDYGTKTQIMILLDMAEKAMYTEKKETHRKYPSINRI